MEELNENGMKHFLSLFLTLSYVAADLEDVVRLQSLPIDWSKVFLFQKYGPLRICLFIHLFVFFHQGHQNVSFPGFPGLYQ